MSEENETIQNRFAFHREEVLHVAQQLEDIRDGRVNPTIVNTELDVLAGHLGQIAKRIEVTETNVLAALDRLNLSEGAFIKRSELVSELLSIVELLKTAKLPTLVVSHLLGQAREMKAEVMAAGFESGG